MKEETDNTRGLVKDTITYDDFAKLDIRIGEIISAEMVPDTDKLIKCRIDFGEEVGERTIVSGIREWVTPEELVGKKLPYLINLEPRKLRGVLSEGMLLAGSCARADGGSDLFLLKAEDNTPPGTVIG